MLNKAILMGRLVADPELRTTANNIPVTSFTIAVDRGYAKQGAEKQTDFIDVNCWRNTAEFVCKWFKKGQMIALEGSIQTRTYTDKDGNKRKAVEILADNVHFADSKRDNSGGDDAQLSPAPAYTTNEPAGFEEVTDDDLPF